MAYTTIDKPTNHFNTVTYTGNVDHSSANGSQAITGVGFQPDWIWIKPKTLGYAAGSHNATDSVRGAGKSIFPDLNAAEYDYGTNANGGAVIAIGSDGFTLGGASQVNEDSNTYAAWNWLAGGSASSNSNGSVTSSVSANTTAGFSIVKYTGAGTGTTTTIGHGLGGVPEVYIVKSLDSVGNWQTYHHKVSSAPETDYIQIDTNSAVADYTFWGDTAPTSTVFTVKDGNDVNESGEEFIAYCFRGIKGYSKFGSYKGNGNANGVFVYCGFRPAWILLKRTNGSGNWQLLDNKRLGYNPENRTIYTNSDIAEQDEDDLDILSNGFKLRSTGTDANGSGDSYIFLAFAENPFVTSGGIPCTAR